MREGRRGSDAVVRWLWWWLGLCDVLAVAGHGWLASEDCLAGDGQGGRARAQDCTGLELGKKRLFVFVIQTRQATALVPHRRALKVFNQRPPFSEELCGF